MSQKKVGRNDPCPCGSGKKYKHCCLRKEQQGRRARAAASHTQRAVSAGPSSLAELRRLAETVVREAPPDETEALQRELELVNELVTYKEMGDEIEAAVQTLEAHRAEFEALVEDLALAHERAERVFAEERFVPFRFSAADVHRAFEAVGYPQRYRSDLKKDAEIFLKAILHLTGEDEDYRMRMARRLMMQLPDYVAAGRYLDGWVIYYSAFGMLETPEESNPFLVEMFQYGLDDWAGQVDAQGERLMRDLGIDLSAGAEMMVEEVEAWLEEQMADPGKRAELEAYYAAHPMMRAEAEAQMRGLEEGVFSLLEREDADVLYLAPEELEPWVKRVMERLEAMQASALDAVERGELDDPEVLQALSDALVETVKEMAPAIFTPERLDKLVADLRGYRRELLAAKEREAAMYAHAAYTLLEQVEDPGESFLLLGICYASLREMLIALSEEARNRGGD
jgi:hypothetical protein